MYPTVLAFSVNKNRLAPVFDVSKRILVVRVDAKGHCQEHWVDLNPGSPLEPTSPLLQMDIERLFCGAISLHYQSILESHGIQVCAFLGGTVDEILSRVMTGRKGLGCHRLPGCGGNRRATRH